MVIMVNAELPGPTANETTTALSLNEALVFLDCYSVVALELMISCTP